MDAGCFEEIVHDLRELLRLAQSRVFAPMAAILDSRTLQSNPESGARAGYDGAKRPNGSKIHVAVDTLGQLLTLHASPADVQERSQVGRLAEAVQQATGEAMEVAFVDQGYTGEQPTAEAAAHGIRLEVVTLPATKRGFMLLPRRWVVERSFAWAAWFRHLARDDERLQTTLGASISLPSSSRVHLSAPNRRADERKSITGSSPNGQRSDRTRETVWVCRLGGMLPRQRCATVGTFRFVPAALREQKFYSTASGGLSAWWTRA